MELERNQFCHCGNLGNSGKSGRTSDCPGSCGWNSDCCIGRRNRDLRERLWCKGGAVRPVVISRNSGSGCCFSRQRSRAVDLYRFGEPTLADSFHPFHSVRPCKLPWQTNHLKRIRLLLLKLSGTSQKVFALYVDAEKCADYRLGTFDASFRGASLPPDWKLPKLRVGNPKLPLNDFVMGHPDAPFVS